MSNMKKQRRSFTEEYRREAAGLVIDTGRSISAVAKELNLGEQTLGTWVKKERSRRGLDGEPTGALDESEREELKRLRKEVFELREDNRFPGKSGLLLRVEATSVERFELMHALKDEFALTRMAALLHVSKSGYYAWKQRQTAGPSARAAAQRERDAKVAKVFNDSHQTYGAPRAAAQLAREGSPADPKTVAASMLRQGIEGISPRRFTPVTTIQGVDTYHLPDRVHRQWDQGALDKVWISDITYLRTNEGWLYLCAVRDGCSRRVLGWSLDSVQNTDLVERALRMARTLRGKIPGQVVFHADRGSQFTSAQLHEVAVELDLLQSVGRTGVCWDNAMSESFWSTLKTEFYDRYRWATRADAKQKVAWWIEDFYNRRRLHSSLGMVPPVEFEQKLRGQQERVEQHRTVLTLAA
ncbi:IS3-like element ISAar26 family transposase [Glutamicibacter sp. AOP3-A1-12]|uniref:IS3-like element ISAar26 family transposase n=1 Tax=Glutamicibacter sp. AOP3-A1-12 TaxID=3457701 RepID=UPI0040340000